ncbi:MAG: IclR family transcriptional regulator [Bryobacterales bacterium]|nr:IclR family transcriptional regulator [Bryobacterales bacterium]
MRARSEQPIKVLSKTFRILDVLHEGNGKGLRLADVVERVGLPKATANRILRSLDGLGLVRFETAQGRYFISDHLEKFGRPPLSATLVQLARPAMTRLVSQFEQTVNLAVVEGDHLVYRHMVEGLHSVRMHAILGTVLSFPKTALGRSILAHLSGDRVTVLAGRTYTSAGIEDLITELEHVRHTGYAVEQGVSEPGLSCVGSAILDMAGRPVAALSISGSASVLNEEVVQVAALRMKQECDAISLKLGYSPPRQKSA